MRANGKCHRFAPWFRAQTPKRQAELAAGIKPEREREVLAVWAATK